MTGPAAVFLHDASMEHALDLRPAGTTLAVLTLGRDAAVPPPPDEAARIRAAAAGDHDAFAELYAGYVRMVHAIVLARVPRADADDLVQDVFLTAFTRLRGLREPAAFGGWLAAIARNRATDHLRQARNQTELREDIPGGDPIEAETMVRRFGRDEAHGRVVFDRHLANRADLEPRPRRRVGRQRLSHGQPTGGTERRRADRG